MQARQPLAVSLQLAQISIRPLLLMSKQDLYTFFVYVYSGLACVW